MRLAYIVVSSGGYDPPEIVSFDSYGDAKAAAQDNAKQAEDGDYITLLSINLTNLKLTELPYTLSDHRARIQWDDGREQDVTFRVDTHDRSDDDYIFYYGWEPVIMDDFNDDGWKVVQVYKWTDPTKEQQ